jgi:uncharacterized protein
LIWALVGAALIGVCLGLLGAGGSILTVPVLVYLVGQPEKVAIASALLIVSSVAAIGAVPHALARQVDWRAALVFGPAAMLGAFLGAFAGNRVPGVVQLLLLGGILIVAAWRLSRALPPQDEAGRAPPAPGGLAWRGALVGALTGLVGIGGGFLIVPALALLGRVPIRRAIGTSLVLIPLQAMSGFWKHRVALDRLGLQLDWDVIWLFIGLGALGTLLGQRLSGRLDQAVLRRAFAGLLVLIGSAMLLAEGWALWASR